MKKYMLCVLLVCCIVTLQSCATPKSAYALQQIWRMGENSFCVREITLTDTYKLASGDDIFPDENCLFVVITCDISLSEGCEIASCTVAKNEVLAESYELFTELIAIGRNINEDAYDQRQSYHLIFCVPTSEISESTFENYHLDIVLVDLSISQAASFAFIK